MERTSSGKGRRLSLVGERLHWAYANVAMAHAALNDGAQAYRVHHYQIRARLYTGLRSGNMSIGSMLADERLKLVLPRTCAYCAAPGGLSLDHLIPRSAGGADTGDNIVWACRSCNSSKGGTDMLKWLAARGIFPPVLLLRRYLKIAVDWAEENAFMDVDMLDAKVQRSPCALEHLPTKMPRPAELCLWQGSPVGARLR